MSTEPTPDQWHCRQLGTIKGNPVVVCERQDLLARIEELEAAHRVALPRHRRVGDVSPEQMLWMLTVAYVTRCPFGVVAMTAENERLKRDLAKFRADRTDAAEEDR